jgi:antitoxin CptB
VKATEQLRVFAVAQELNSTYIDGTKVSSSGLDVRRRRLLFRSWHRGIREMDLIMGRFADAFIARLNGQDLDDYERLSEVPDPELLEWIIGEGPVPAAYDCDVLHNLRAFHRGRTES